MYEQLKHILADIVLCVAEEIPDDAALTTLANWDSLRHLELMLALEAEFDVRIQAEEIPELVSLVEIDAYLRVRGTGYGV